MPVRVMAAAFGQEHDALRHQVAAMRALLTFDRPADLGPLLALRPEFERLITAHVRGEKWVLYPRVIAASDGSLNGLARALAGGIDRLIERCQVHKRRWTARAITADWDGYRLAAEDILDALEAQMTAEDEHLYPILSAAAAGLRAAA